MSWDATARGLAAEIAHDFVWKRIAQGNVDALARAKDTTYSTIAEHVDIVRSHDYRAEEHVFAWNAWHNLQLTAAGIFVTIELFASALPPTLLPTRAKETAESAALLAALARTEFRVVARQRCRAKPYFDHRVVGEHVGDVAAAFLLVQLPGCKLPKDKNIDMDADADVVGGRAAVEAVEALVKSALKEAEERSRADYAFV